MKSIEGRVVDFFNRWIFRDKQNSLDKVINTINLDREDAVMIFEEFLNEFDIESGYYSFDIDKYFYKLTFLDSLLIKFFSKRIKEKYGKKNPITISHMIEVAKRREWFDPILKE